MTIIIILIIIDFVLGGWHMTVKKRMNLVASHIKDNTE